MTTETTLTAKSDSFYATDEDRARIAAIMELLRRRGNRSSKSAAISYALARVFLTECSEDGSMLGQRDAA